MEHLSLEIFDLEGTGSKYAYLPEDASITITDTSEIFASGDVWSHSFTLNVRANAHIFGTAGDMHGSRLHEQINKRRARLWVEGVALYLGYLKLDDEVEVDSKGNVDVSFESGQKTFDEMIEGTKAREVSVGDVVIGVALNRKRVVNMISPIGLARLDGLEAYAVKDARLKEAANATYRFDCGVSPNTNIATPYVQQWPKLVKSQGKVFNSSWGEETADYTNVQTPYDASHAFCNINICYPFKVNDKGEEKSGRGYTVRLAHGGNTTDGGDNQTRYNNAPNFYLLHFIDRLFKDLKIHVKENQAMDVQDLRRVFMLNYGCHYEELEGTDLSSPDHTTPSNRRERYGQYYIPVIDEDSDKYLLESWDKACMQIQSDSDIIGKVLLRDVEVLVNNVSLLKVGSIEGTVADVRSQISGISSPPLSLSLSKESGEESNNAYSAYLAYATGDNYPNVDISEIIEAMKAMFGVRLLFSDDYKQVRIVLLRNIFRSKEVQTINCEVVDADVKIENCIRGFRMTYGKGTDDTNYYYKGFNDLFPRIAKTWKDTTDKHDYSQWDTISDYNTIKQFVSGMNKTCYVTPETGNAYAVKVDEEEDVLYPSLFEVGAFMDAEDGDCSKSESDGNTVKEVKIDASPVIMNEIGNTYALLYSGDMKAPSPDDSFEYATKIATFGRVLSQSKDTVMSGLEKSYLQVKGKLDVYISEGFQIRMKDNYSISNSGTPFDDVNPGLCFGIMRGSGDDARVAYYEDTEENEVPMNDYWEIVPGSGAIDHVDTCDSYGNEWDYNGTGGGIGSRDGRISLKLRAEKLNPYYSSQQEQQEETTPIPTTTITTKDGAATAMKSIFTWSNPDLLNRPKVSGSAMRAAGWTEFTGDYATLYSIQKGVRIYGGEIVEILWTPIMADGTILSPAELDEYVAQFDNGDIWTIWGLDWLWKQLILDVYTTEERAVLLHELQALYYDNNPSGSVVIYGGETTPSGSAFDFNTKDRYLPITNKNLRNRGLCDQFYKEYSFWERNARIIKRTVKMELAQFISIDKTKRVKVGDITGFIRKRQFTVSNKTGMGNVTMEIMYI